MNNKIKAWIKLSRVKNLGTAKMLQLVKALGEPEGFVGKGSEHFSDITFLKTDQKRELAKDEDPQDWPKICRLIEKNEIKFTAYTDPDYPDRLTEIYDPPLFLFYRGTLSSPQDEKAIAVVGTRKPDNYGIMMTRKITSDLVSAGFTIVSGLAYGVDTQAHKVAVESQSRTIAVLGTGCDNIYPSRNQQLAENIIDNDGVIISEQIPGVVNESWVFPARNRIISALSIGTFIVQGKKTSGALITAKHALEQNKDLFALPGDINRSESEGPNYLIKLGAKIVTGSADILEDYELYLFQENEKEISLNENESLVLNVIKENRPEISYDDLVIKSGLSISEISVVILSLEMKGLVFVGNANMISAK